MSVPSFSHKVSSTAHLFDSQVRPVGESDGQLVLGRMRVLFNASDICCCSRVCVCSRVRAWQRVRARPPAHRLPSDRLAIHQRTCSPALPDKKAAPLIPRLSPLPLLGSCRHLTARGKLTRCAQAICQQKEILARSLSWCVLAPALSVCVLSPGRIRPRRAWQQFRESSKQGPDLPIWMVRVFSCCLDCNAALQGANIFVKLC